MTSLRIIPALRKAPADIEVAYRWTSDELASSRTLARNFLALRVELPPRLLDFADRLLGCADDHLYASSGIEVIDDYADQKYGFSHHEAKSAALSLCGNALAELAIGITPVEIATCREQCFHHDEVQSEQQAYFALILAQTKPLAFHSMGAELNLEAGDLLVFDAQQPHALIRQGETTYKDVAGADLSHRFVFALGAVPLTRQLRKHLGMRIKKPSTNWRAMRHVEYSENSGEFA
jgi:hypothetical protein